MFISPMRTTILIAAIGLSACTAAGVAAGPTTEETELAFSLTWDPHMSRDNRPRIGWIGDDCTTRFDGVKVKANNGNCLGTYLDSENNAVLRWGGAISADLGWCSTMIQLSNQIKTGNFDARGDKERVAACQDVLVGAGL